MVIERRIKQLACRLAVAALMLSQGVSAIAQGRWHSTDPSAHPARPPQEDSSSYHPMPAGWQGVYAIIGKLNAVGPTGLTVSVPQSDGLTLVSPNLGAVAIAHLRPWARELMQDNQMYSGIDDLGAICGPAGLFRHSTTVAGYMLLQAPGQIILVSQDLDQVGVRRVYLAERHPDNIVPTWDGDSIGHWEGDTLVIDTIGFNDRSWLFTELEPHTEALHLIERLRMVKGGRYLEIYSTLDDRQALTGPYSYSRYYRRADKTFEQTEQSANTCNPDVGEQAEWVHFRDQSIHDYDDSRNQQPTASGRGGSGSSSAAPGGLAHAAPAANDSANADYGSTPAQPLSTVPQAPVTPLVAPTPRAPPPSALPVSAYYLPDSNPKLAPLGGVYDVVPDGLRIPGGWTNQGSPSEIQSAAAARVPADSKRASDLDPYGLCQPIGPFRMMAQEGLRVQLVPASNRLVILFQDILHGYLRSLYLDTAHPANYKAKYAWQGNSVAHLQGDTLVVDTVGFDDRTWLNQHTIASSALHLVERFQPIDGGRYLFYQMTATDPKSLKSPYSYTRYFQRVEKRIRQDICTPHTTWTLEDGF